MQKEARNLEGRRIVLGLSGGVDSAVSAILLKARGADVHALHMTNWEDDDGYCTAARDLQDARRVCERLDIPFHPVNFAREYREQVFSEFLAEYRAGRTPNPDVLCNREIKFGVFLDHARRLGGELIATGHYARTSRHGKATHLLRAADAAKDQSYFLHAVDQDALADTVFPLGELQKSAVRAIARDHVLDVHDKKDSTGICFIGERPFREFLARHLAADPGPMKTPEGLTVGEHSGLVYYTLGQRQGLGIGGRRDADDAPWYVAAKDVPNNTLVVVQGDHPLRFSEALVASRQTWVNGIPDVLAGGGTLHVAAKVRYRQPDQDCTVRRLDDDRLLVTFTDRQADVAPGQFVVFYDGDRCLGGAVIDSAVRAREPLLMAG